METLRTLRTTAGMSQMQLALKLGVSRSTIAMWETGKSQPDNDFLVQIAQLFGTTTDQLLGRDDTISTDIPPGPNWVPVKGVVRAGIPIDAVEDIIDWEELTPAMARSGSYLGLRIVGDSMEPRFREGDTVIVRVQPNLESGEVGVVLVNGDTATVKKVIKTETGIMLVALNPNYEPKFYDNNEITTLPVRVLGKVVELRAKF